jgi:hypothetical protein
VKGGAPGKLLEMRTIVVDNPLLELLKSSSEMSFDNVEISPHTDDTCNVAAWSVPR